MTAIALPARRSPHRVWPAVDPHPDTPAARPHYARPGAAGDPYRQLCAVVMLTAVRDVRRGYQAGLPLASQPQDVQKALAFLAHGLGSGKAPADGKVLVGRGRRAVAVEVTLIHEAAGQELLTEMDEEALAERICSQRRLPTIMVRAGGVRKGRA